MNSSYSTTKRDSAADSPTFVVKRRCFHGSILPRDYIARLFDENPSLNQT
jgi:hypothetical protein